MNENRSDNREKKGSAVRMSLILLAAFALYGVYYHAKRVEQKELLNSLQNKMNEYEKDKVFNDYLNKRYRTDADNNGVVDERDEQILLMDYINRQVIEDINRNNKEKQE